MTPAWGPLATAATIGLLALYEWQLWRSLRHADGAHAGLRQDWLQAVSAQAGSELLAVQTLRNALMSATMTASTAVLGLMGTLSLAAPRLGSAGAGPLALHLLLVLLLLASLLASALAVRDYKHASFIVAMPVASEARQRWAGRGGESLRRAGRLYGWSLRQLFLVGPVLAALLQPLAGPLLVLLLITVLLHIDRPAVTA